MQAGFAPAFEMQAFHVFYRFAPVTVEQMRKQSAAQNIFTGEYEGARGILRRTRRDHVEALAVDELHHLVEIPALGDIIGQRTTEKILDSDGEITVIGE